MDENTKAFLEETLQETRKLNSKIDQVASIFTKINQRHVDYLNKLIANPEDKKAIDDLNALLVREENILKICNWGLHSYDVTLQHLEKEIGRFFKVKLLNEIDFLRDVVRIYRKQIERLRRRVTLEQSIIKKKKSHHIRRLIRIINREDRDIRGLINQVKPERLYQIRNTLVGFVETKTATKTQEYLRESGSMDPSVFGGLGDVVLIGIAVPISISESLINLVRGFFVTDRTLLTEIARLKASA